MNTLYLDIFSGISGDMFIGAMLDLGVELEPLKRELEKLNLSGYELHAHRKSKGNIVGWKFDVILEEQQTKHTHAHHHHSGHSHSHGHSESRDFADIQKLIADSALSDWVKERSTSVFRRVAEAEGKVHGLPPEKVHFHEVGAVDSIVDIVGACICLEMLSKPRVLAAPVVEGHGWVDCAHGRFPVPTAATLEILGARGIALTQCEEPHELVTPTGAALLAEFVEKFGPMDHLAAAKIGYGLGTRENQTRPNVLRAVLGESASEESVSSNDWETDRVAVLETNLDDINSEVLGHFVETVLQAGALDVFHTPVQMKKNRPGVLLTVLCREAEADRFTEMMLRQTSAFGVRRTISERRKLQREVISVNTEFGEVTAKIGRLNGQCIQVSPEYESCKALSEKTRVPLKTIYDAVVNAYRNKHQHD